MERQPAGAADRRMIKAAVIENFRGFRRTELQDCRRVNIIVGANASGKTALLEALFLASGGSPEIALRFRQWRGLEQGVTGVLATDFLWNDLFYNFDKDNEISIKLIMDPFGQRSLDISYTGDKTVLLPGYNLTQAHYTPSPVSFTWETPDGKSTITPIMGPMGNIQISGAAQPKVENYFFSSGGHYSAADTANRFSQLSQNYQEQEIVDVFTSEFPKIDKLGVEIYNGIPALSGSIGGIPKKLPLALISGGVNKFATILCCLHFQRHTTLFVDEIENGFYFNRLESLWRNIHKIAMKNEAQIFASTHSAECLQAASLIAEKYPDDFSVIHLGKHGSKHFQGRQFTFAMEEDIEIR